MIAPGTVPDEGSHCVLMFSGGRDSTLAAIQLAESFKELTLVTVVSDHLIGVENVQRRMAELDRILPNKTEWLTTIQPKLDEGAFSRPTCLPCHRAYAAVGATIAKQLGVSDLAFGYVSYQAGWPEQGPEAISRLKSALASEGIRLHVPVYERTSKDQVKFELQQLGLSPEALEQKCLQQQNNVTLPPEILSQELNVWEHSIRAALRASIPLKTFKQQF